MPGRLHGGWRDLRRRGRVQGWGRMRPEGRVPKHPWLGLGDKVARGGQPSDLGDALPAVDLGTGRSAIALSAGESHTCALLDDAAIKCWGANDVGQLGLGDTQSRGDDADELGDRLPAV